MTLQPAPLPLLPLPLGGGLTNQQLNVRHIESAVCKDFHKAKFHENLDCPLHGANLVPGEGGDGLDGMGKMLVEHEDSAGFQRHEIHFQQQIRVQQTIRHTLQDNHSLAVVETFFQFEIVKSPVFSHRVKLLCRIAVAGL